MKKFLAITLTIVLALAVFAMPASAKHTPAAVLKSIRHLAEEGGILNCDMTVQDSTIDDFVDEYGHYDRSNYVASAKGNYATFSHHNIVVGFGRGDQVFELRSYSKRLEGITESELKDQWGEPDHSTKSNGQRMLSYDLGDYNCKFVFDDGGESLNHYNVIWLDGTKNSAADDHGRNW